MIVLLSMLSAYLYCLNKLELVDVYSAKYNLSMRTLINEDTGSNYGGFTIYGIVPQELCFASVGAYIGWFLYIIYCNNSCCNFDKNDNVDNA